MQIHSYLLVKKLLGIGVSSSGSSKRKSERWLTKLEGMFSSFLARMNQRRKHIENSLMGNVKANKKNKKYLFGD